MISRPPDCDTATLRGAAQYGLARRPLVSSVVAPQSYMLQVCSIARSFVEVTIPYKQVKLPAEQEDELKRPAYISANNAGVRICENRLVLKTPLLNRTPLMVPRVRRLQYLVVKGAILRKG